MSTVFLQPPLNVAPSTWSQTPGHGLDIDFHVHTDPQQTDVTKRPQIFAVPVLIVQIDGSKSRVGYVHVPGVTDATGWDSRYQSCPPRAPSPWMFEDWQFVAAVDRMSKVVSEENKLPSFSRSHLSSMDKPSDDRRVTYQEQSHVQDSVVRSSVQPVVHDPDWITALSELRAHLEIQASAFARSTRELCGSRPTALARRWSSEESAHFIIALLDRYCTMIPTRFSGERKPESFADLETAFGEQVAAILTKCE